MIGVVGDPGDRLAFAAHGFGETGDVRGPAARGHVSEPVIDRGHGERRVDLVGAVQRERGVDAKTTLQSQIRRGRDTPGEPTQDACVTSAASEQTC